jgi:hypothetical protein
LQGLRGSGWIAVRGEDGYIPKDGNIHIFSCENLKYYIKYIVLYCYSAILVCS